MTDMPRQSYRDGHSALALASVWIGLLLGLPFTFAPAFNLPYREVNIVAAASVLLFIAVLISADIKRFRINMTIASILLAQATLFAIVGLYHQDTSYIFSIVMSIGFAMLLCFVVDSFVGWGRFAKSYIYLMCLMSFLVVIGFILAAAGVLDPIASFRNPDGRRAMNFAFTFTNVAWPAGSSWFIRPAGYFDEPGTLGFFVSFALVVNRYLRGSPAAERMLLIGGLASTSFGFYVFALFYLAITNPKILGILVILALVASAMLVRMTDSSVSPLLERARMVTIDRVLPSTDSTRILQGDNRSQVLVESVRAWATNPQFGIGRSYIDDPKSDWYQSFLGANPMAPFATGGVVGALATYLVPSVILLFTIMLWFGYGITRDELLSSGLLVLSAMHRPFFMTPLIILVLFAILALMVRKYMPSLAHTVSKYPHETGSVRLDGRLSSKPAL